LDLNRSLWPYQDIDATDRHVGSLGHDLDGQIAAASSYIKNLRILEQAIREVGRENIDTSFEDEIMVELFQGLVSRAG